jgi:hypothetical protein
MTAYRVGGALLIIAHLVAGCRFKETPAEAMCAALSDVIVSLDQLAALTPATSVDDYTNSVNALHASLSSVESAAPGPWCCALPMEVPGRARAITTAGEQYLSSLSDARDESSPAVTAMTSITATARIRAAVAELDEILYCDLTLD